MNYPEISVVIPTHNNGPELERAILSVLNQDAYTGVENWVEIIIVNDCSDEMYLENYNYLANKYACIKLFHNQKQSGPGITRNVGVRHATKSLLSFIDSDDEWPLNKLTILLPYLKDERIDMAGGKVKFIILDGVEYPELKYEDEEQRLTHVHLGSLLMRTSLFHRGFYFDETYTFSDDMDWWVRLRENGINIVMTEQTTLLYYLHGENITIKNKDFQLLEVVYKSLQRRRANNLSRNIPQVRDFRTERPDPLISIILPLYNGKAHVKRTIDGIIAQTYQNIELIVVDDGSTDGGAEFIAEIYPSSKIITQVNGGVAKARNIGIKASSGELVAFLDQDDEWMPSKLTEQWTLLKSNPYAAVVTCNQLFKFENGTPWPSFFKDELKNEHRSLVASSLLVRKHALLSISGFDESMVFASDLDAVRRIRNAGYKDENVDKLLLYKWYHGGNESLDKPKNLREILMVLKKQAHKNE